MGEKFSKDFNIVNEYRKISEFPIVEPSYFQVNLEMECFMSVNVIRHNPKAFKGHFEHIIDFKDGYKGKHAKKFLKWLEKLEPLQPLAIDTDVMAACVTYNAQLKSETNESNIPRNGASQIFRSMVGTTQSTDVESFTYTATWNHSAHELMLLNILLDFDR